MPSLALCIPAYNAATFLPRLLESASAQTVPFDEVLVYDDASPDNTGAIATQYGATVVRGKTNLGCACGKNVLAHIARSDWLHFHDADDDLLPDFVERAQTWLTKPDVDVVLFGYEEIDASTGDHLATHRYDNAALRHDPVEYTIRTQIQPFIGVYHRERFLAAGGADTDPLVLYNEDVAMHCQLARAGLRFAADPSVTVVNYRNAASMSSNKAACARAQFHVMQKAAQFPSPSYAVDISNRLWTIATWSGSYLDWDYVDAGIRLAISLGSRAPNDASDLFRVLCLANPRVAYRLREYAIRLGRPHLRAASTKQPILESYQG
jgi:glycosyltransferase involved in cell wall biosynthesis